MASKSEETLVFIYKRNDKTTSASLDTTHSNAGPCATNSIITQQAHESSNRSAEDTGKAALCDELMNTRDLYRNLKQNTNMAEIGGWEC